MRAALCPAHGPPEVVEVRELPSPARADGQLRVRVHVAAVNFPDVLLVAGRYQVAVPPPFVPGSEFAGVVVETDGVASGFTVGDRVTGTAMFGAFAEQVCLPPEALARVPDGIDDRAAAASGVAFRTAYHALRSVARVTPGDDVVVLGAGGGVGLAAVALATALGARVTAVAGSADKLSAAARYGAVHGIDHRGGDLREALRAALPDGAAAVLDPVGGALAEPALRSLHRGGRFVTIGYASGDIPRIPLNLILVKGITVAGFGFRDVPADEFTRNESELRRLLATGAVTPHIGAEYPLAEAAAALRHVADGRAIGKVLVQINPAAY
ncbi:NADPH:quinone oxidoreductase family protein [Mycolicibacterium bacteremicum]|uniref:NADPH:quinone oxidoreductase n=1 Tax=Mycolicibacterium bacteremicum TaxID=564198 RepID=A0A1W9YYN7_MYCBA|nr:NADPH:quinone oxidoreductase family protein [Mycolicibacterium bacteremicum]MCV7431337.1 NADPH:quinone oxidoreductase family protein [Mycolicibacterium bacteremicum]ORA05107.1 NADPH:quinone oxidoreductase [Mycolicibacterium bacteremicum]